MENVRNASFFCVPLEKYNCEQLISVLSTLTDKEKLIFLENEIVKTKLFSNHFFYFERLNISFKDSSYYDLLLSTLNVKQKIIVLRGISDENYLTNYLISNFKIIDGINAVSILRNIHDDNNLKKLINVIDNKFYKSELISQLNNIKDKFLFFDMMLPNDQIRFLKSLDESERIDYIDKNIHAPYLIASLSDKDLIIKYFKKQNLLNQKKIIKLIDDEQLKYELYFIIKDKIYPDNSLLIYLLKTVKNHEQKNNIISLLSDDNLFKVIDSNKNKEELILSQTNLNYIPFFDENISFGLELELSHFNNSAYIVIGKILGDWIIKDENTVKDGLEITSPILHYTKNDLKKIKYVCDFISQSGLKTTNDCGGHIHIGFDYVKNINQLKLLYGLFAKYEEIFYAIGNKSNHKIRNGVYVTSKSIKPIYKNMSDKRFDLIADLNDYVNLLKFIQCNDRYYNINIINALSEDKNTIEFRFLNGETDYYELQKNIMLILSLIEFAGQNELSVLEKDFEYIDEKKDYLFDLLWHNNSYLKGIYEERYQNNKNFYFDKERKLTK